MMTDIEHLQEYIVQDENPSKQTMDLFEGYGKALNENVDYMNELAKRLNVFADAFNELVDRVRELEKGNE